MAPKASITVDLSAATTAADKKDAINTALGASNDIQASLDGETSGKLVFTSSAGKSFQVMVANDQSNALGMGHVAGRFRQLRVILRHGRYHERDEWKP